MKKDKNEEFPLRKYPQLVKEWHPTKNPNICIETISLGSSQKIRWRCSKEESHEWGATVCDRVNRGRGCPFCSGRKVARENSFGTLNPNLVREWHPENTISPFEIAPSSGKKVRWLCKNGAGHEWEATVGSRTAGNGCPFCSGHRVSFQDSLATKYPELAAEVHPLKNQTLRASEISPNYRKLIWWQCPKKHSYKNSPLARCKQYDNGIKNACLECNGLKALYPELAKQWHPEKNLPQTAETISIGSNFKATWVCPENPSHDWEQSVKGRVIALKRNVTRGSECPICLNRKATEETCLKQTHPLLAMEWDHERNSALELSLDQITAVSRSKAFWICHKNPIHKWDADIRSRAGTKKKKGSGCPYCINRKVSQEKSLAITHPELAKEWHPTKNFPLTPYDLSFGSNQKVYWQCRIDPTHEWEAIVSSRSNGRGCQFCARWTVDRLRLFVKSIAEHIPSLSPAELFVLFERSGALHSSGQAKGIAKAIQSKKMSKEELIAFSEGKPSAFEETLASHHELDEKHKDLDQHNSLSDELSISPDDTDPLNILPTIQAGAALAALDKATSLITDEDAVLFFIASKKLQVWQHVADDEEEALQQIQSFHGGKYAEEVKRSFEEEYLGAKKLNIPQLADKTLIPSIMQRLTCFRLLREQSLGNWSGTGAGKTLSAVIAAHMTNAKLIIVVCPNNVISGWEKTVKRTFPRSNVILKGSHSVTLNRSKHPTYLVLNYEFFQQASCRTYLNQILAQHSVDFFVMDEIHFSKQREKNKMSIRKNNIFWFLQKLREQNPNLYVLGMSATPVINNLYEGKTLLELIKGQTFDFIDTKNTLPNCMALHQLLIRYGIRIRPKYSATLNIRTIEVDCSEALPALQHLRKRDILGLETALAKVKIPSILNEIQPKTLIYSHYVENIIETLKSNIKQAGYTVATFTGQEKDSLELFTKGQVDVLIASRCISTGVDGLQEVCAKVIIISLPWTGGEFEQIYGRVHRQGQTKDTVEIVIPVTFLESHGEKRSWCQTRYDRIRLKKTMADAAVDGVISEEHIRSPEQAFDDHMVWVRKLEN